MFLVDSFFLNQRGSSFGGRDMIRLDSSKSSSSSDSTSELSNGDGGRCTDWRAEKPKPCALEFAQQQFIKRQREDTHTDFMFYLCWWCPGVRTQEVELIIRGVRLTGQNNVLIVVNIFSWINCWEQEVINPEWREMTWVQSYTLDTIQVRPHSKIKRQMAGCIQQTKTKKINEKHDLKCWILLKNGTFVTSFQGFSNSD